MVALGEQAPGCPQLAMLRVNGSIYFGAVEHVREQFHRVDEAAAQRKWLLLLAQGVNFIDLAGAQLLTDEAQRRRALGGGLVVVGAQPAVQHMLERSEAIAAIGSDRLIAHKGDALRMVYPLLDSAVCSRCTLRIFDECQSALPDATPRVPPRDERSSKP
jgi:SulP family sulfate permease